MTDKEVNVVDGVEEVLIDQNEKRGPGKFLILSYIVIVVFCVYYLFTYWNWKSDYEIQQEEIKAQVEAASS